MQGTTTGVVRGRGKCGESIKQQKKKADQAKKQKERKKIGIRTTEANRNAKAG